MNGGIYLKNIKNNINDIKRIKLMYGNDSLTVEEVLQLSSFSGAEVLGGSIGLKNQCNHMTILETPDGINWLEGGEVLLTAGYAFYNNEEAKQDMVINAYKRGVAAIAIKENRYFGDISDELLEDSNKYGLPLIKIPYDVVYTDTISSFYNLLFYRKNQYILNLNSIYEKLLNLTFENKDIDGIIYSLSNLSNSNVFLFDSNFNILSNSIVDHESYRDISCFSPFNNYGKPIHGNIDKLCINIKINNSYICIYPIIRNKRTIAFLYLINKDKISVLEQSAIEYGLSIISMKLEREKMIKLSKTRFNKILVETMLNNKDLPKEFYNNVERDLGWDEEGSFVGICIKIDIIEKKNVIDFNNIIYEILNDIFGADNYLTTDRINEIFLFFKIRSDIYLKDIVNDIGKNANIYKDRFLISIGVSNIYNGLEEIEKLYNESYLAVLFCRKGITYYNSLHTMKLLYPLKDDKEIKNYYNGTIKKIEDYDKKHGTYLMKTIEYYLENNMNKKITASKLFIHVETLRYRLSRVEEISGYSIDDAEGIFALQMGLKLKRILKLK